MQYKIFNYDSNKFRHLDIPPMVGHPDEFTHDWCYVYDKAAYHHMYALVKSPDALWITADGELVDIVSIDTYKRVLWVVQPGQGRECVMDDDAIALHMGCFKNTFAARRLHMRRLLKTTWGKTIATAATNGHFDPNEKHQAANWGSCCCSKIEGIERDPEDGAPIDTELYNLGMRFNDKVQADEFDKAAEYLVAIHDCAKRIKGGK